MPARLLSVVGARPQFIKFLPVAKALQHINRDSKIVEHILVHTGQHYDYQMSKVFFEELGIPEPSHHLGVGSGSHAVQTGNILIKVEEVLSRHKVDCVIVYGDTNSTVGAAISATKMGIPVAHVEAGLRSYNRDMPEEVNRILTDRVSSLLFCPSLNAVQILRGEGFSSVVNDGQLCSPSDWRVAKTGAHGFRNLNTSLVVNSGDVMYEVLFESMRIAEQKSRILKQLHLEGKDYYLLTIHRAENIDSPTQLERIVQFVNEASHDTTVIFPVHPRARRTAFSGFAPNVHRIEPVGYFDSIVLLKNCAMVLTDSGGLQKEAYWLKVPCVTLRTETEWIETVKDGWNVLYKDYRGSFPRPSMQGKPYGEGGAAETIVTALADVFGT